MRIKRLRLNVETFSESNTFSIQKCLEKFNQFHIKKSLEKFNKFNKVTSLSNVTDIKI